MVLSASPAGSYYIYSFDGKLMAEYDMYGQLVRYYIYMGNQLIAEYKGTSYYYYTSDQINSTRIVTDGTGNVTYAAAYDPYGGIQKTWGTPTYTPTRKFSGKERDVESGLDYFGARYHASFHYRWLSVDPVMNREEALANPQLWNLYAFCRNSPVTYFDPDGRVNFKLNIDLQYVSSQSICDDTKARTYGGYTLPDFNIESKVIKQDNSWIVRVDIEANYKVRVPAEEDSLYEYKGVTGYPKSPQEALNHEMSHVLVNLMQVEEVYNNAKVLEGIKFPVKIAATLASWALEADAFVRAVPLKLDNLMIDAFKISLIK